MNDSRAWVILAFGIVAIVFGVWLFATLAWGAEKGFDAELTWQLRVNSYPVEGLGDLTKEECGQAAVLLEPQVAPFLAITCVEIEVKKSDA